MPAVEAEKDLPLVATVAAEDLSHNAVAEHKGAAEAKEDHASSPVAEAKGSAEAVGSPAAEAVHATTGGDAAPSAASVTEAAAEMHKVRDPDTML